GNRRQRRARTAAGPIAPAYLRALRRLRSETEGEREPVRQREAVRRRGVRHSGLEEDGEAGERGDLGSELEVEPAGPGLAGCTQRRVEVRVDRRAEQRRRAGVRDGGSGARRETEEER